MENSELRKRTISLGKALVEELKLNPGVDTLSRWMVHYIAEQMTVAENATGDKKRVAEQRCFETILRLWQHRSALPNGHRPFESFEPIFRALSKLDPDNPQPYYYSRFNATSSETDEVSKEPNEVLQWIDLANAIDRSARILIEFIFHQASLIAKDKKTINWLINAIGISPNDDVSIVVRLVNTYEDSEKETNISDNEQSEKIQSRIQQLNTLITLSQEIRSLLIKQAKSANRKTNSDKDHTS
jgi:hypothetical protein